MPTRRILALGSHDSHVLDLLKDLTTTAPAPHPTTGSTAGLTHEWDVKTPYYTAKVPIWIDEVTDPTEWEAEFLKEEAGEVVRAVGAWVVCFVKASSSSTNSTEKFGYEVEAVLKAVQTIVEEHVGYGAETVMLAVAMPGSRAAQARQKDDSGGGEEWEDMCMQYGFEYIDYGAQGTNEFGEKVGRERVREALETNDWSATADDEDEDEDGGEQLDLGDLDLDDDDEDDFGAFLGREEAALMTAELFGMKGALTRNDEEGDDDEGEDEEEDDQAGQVEGMNVMMAKLLAAKEQSVDLPEAQRRKMAAKAVREVMGG